MLDSRIAIPEFLEISLQPLRYTVFHLVVWPDVVYPLLLPQFLGIQIVDG
jgi:hypothetical protein